MKYKKYPRYKDSGIEYLGEIPEHWEVIKGKFLFKNKKIKNDKLECMDRLALTLNGVIERKIDDSEGLQPFDFKSYQIVYKNDLIFKLIDLENYKTSRVGLVWKKGIMSPAYIRIFAIKNLDIKYYYYYYFNLYLRGVYNEIGSQGVRSSLNAEELLNIEIPLPHLFEQKAIASFLDKQISKIDNLIKKDKS
jgi:type I restriction enzyme S subunit